VTDDTLARQRPGETDSSSRVEDRSGRTLAPVHELVTAAKAGDGAGTTTVGETVGQEAPPVSFDPTRKFVRVTRIRDDRLVEFDFAMGEPEIYVELILPFDAFEEFCSANDVHHLTPEEAAAVDYDRMKWRYGRPGLDH